MMIKWLIFILISTVLMADDYCNAFRAYSSDDFQKAKKLLDPMAFKGDLKAQNLLGVLNIEDEKYSVARRWLQGAATKGDAKAAYNLGLYYYDQAQISQTRKWMLKAESLSEAKMALGLLYLQKNRSKSKSYFYQAYQEGNSFAKAHLCVLKDKKKDKMSKTYESLCRGYEVEASYLTGKFYTSPKKYGSRDKAILYLKYAAENRHTEAMNLLGELLSKRNGPMDQDNAMRYFLKAAEQGSIDAQLNAAWYYYTGLRWTRDPIKGKAMLESAFNQRSAKAEFYIGVLYLKGASFSGGTYNKDVKKGWEYIRRAALRDEVKALEYVIKYSRDTALVTQSKKQLKRYNKGQTKLRALHYLYEGC